MAVTPEFLARQIQNPENASAVFDQYIPRKEGESAEDFQQRTQPIIEQTMMLIGENSAIPAVATDMAKQAEEQAIQKYTRRLAIKAQLELEEQEGTDSTHKNFQELNNNCLFSMIQMESKHPEIENKTNKETVEAMRLEFVNTLQKIPLAILRQYENIRNEFSELTDKTHKGSLTAEESNKLAELKTTQRELEQTYPEIRYRLLLSQAGSKTFPSKHPPFLFSAANNFTESDIHSITVQTSSAKRNNSSADHSAIGSFFTSAAKMTKKILSKPAPAEEPKTQSHATLPNTSRQFFSKPAPAEDPQTQYPNTIYYDYDYLFKISLLGDPGVGTSHLRERFAKNIYSEQFRLHSNEAYVFEIKTIVTNRFRVKLQVWTAEVYSKEELISWVKEPCEYHTWPAKKDERCVQFQRARSAHAIIVAFDVTDYKSFENLTEWSKEIERYTNRTVQPLAAEMHTLAATKCDIPEKDWAVKKDDIHAFAEENSLNVFFTSAKDNSYIDELFEYVTDLIIQEKQSKKKEESIQISPHPHRF